MVGCSQNNTNKKEINTEIQENQKQDMYNNEMILTSEIIEFEDRKSVV